jgi:hypothetical protein
MSGNINWENTIPVLSKICAKHFPAIRDENCQSHGNTLWSAFVDGKTVEYITNNNKKPVEDIEQLSKIANQLRLAIEGFEKIGPIGLNAIADLPSEHLDQLGLTSVEDLQPHERIQDHLSQVRNIIDTANKRIDPDAPTLMAQLAGSNENITTKVGRKQLETAANVTDTAADIYKNETGNEATWSLDPYDEKDPLQEGFPCFLNEIFSALSITANVERQIKNFRKDKTKK